MGESPSSIPYTLAAIVFTDIVGFSRLMAEKEAETLPRVKAELARLRKVCENHGGKVLKSTGDGLLMHFTSAVQAVACALEIQRLSPPVDGQIQLKHRIGIHLGDVSLEDGDVMGDGVNIAARLQTQADPGGICISKTVYDVVKNRIAIRATFLGPRELKNISGAVPIYKILIEAQDGSPIHPVRSHRRPAWALSLAGFILVVLLVLASGYGRHLGFHRGVATPSYSTTASVAPASPPATADAQFTTTTNNDQVAITKYAGPGGAVGIPETINGLPVISIGKGAFLYCASLTGVTIPSSVTSIGSQAFGGCSSLTSITVSSQNPIYSSSTDGILFNKNQTTLIEYPVAKAGSYTIPNSVISIGDSAFQGCTNLTSVTIPSSVTGIGRGAFLACGSLTGVTIPSSVTNIGSQAFGDGDRGLISITVSPQNPSYSSSADGVLFDKNQTTLIQCPAVKAGSYTIPNSVTSIEVGAFDGCARLTSVTIPTSVSSISWNAFKGCHSLTSAIFEGNAPTMGPDVFKGAPGGFKVSYSTAATGFTSPTWTDSSGDSFPAVNLGKR